MQIRFHDKRRFMIKSTNVSRMFLFSNFIIMANVSVFIELVVTISRLFKVLNRYQWCFQVAICLIF